VKDTVAAAEGRISICGCVGELNLKDEINELTMP
jgi:hypothetical protein